jgi:predicted CXXCH cytochrome family protein
MTLPSGETLSLYVDSETMQSSIHGVLNVRCVQCHEDIEAYPHPPADYTDLRDVAIENAATCEGCHGDIADKAADSIHHEVLASGNREAPVCTDCHTAHAVHDPATPRTRVQETCSQCHSEIADEYAASVHGAAIGSSDNPDVPTCVDCHGVHNIGDPTTAEFRLNSPELCAACHTDPAMMSKYGLSTDVLNTYVADFHGTTVELFAKQHPDQATNKPVCYDCHGIHNIKSTQDPTSAVTTRENLLKTCQKCHPDATAESFTAAWMSHYQASPTTYPLVFFINLFYWIFIPLTIGGMGIFLATDVYHRLRARPHPRAKEDEAN